MVTFEEARRRVEADMRKHWQSSQGTLVVLPDGFEDTDGWHILAGAREYLVDDNPDFALLNSPAIVVSKKTGEIERLVVLESFDRLQQMRPVSA
jgi:hypothetical protein